MLEGLTVFNEVISADIEEKLIAFIEQDLNDRMHLEKERAKGQGKEGKDYTYLQSTYKDPVTQKRGNGRQILQYGSFYDYQQHRINPQLQVEPIPHIIAELIKHGLNTGIIPAHAEPDSVIVNIYRPASASNKVPDYITPHVDHKSYPRPFSTVSLASSTGMLFGDKIVNKGNGVFDAPVQLLLAPRSWLRLDGRGANKTQHCVPGVPQTRYSITLRKMPKKAAEETKKRQRDKKRKQKRNSKLQQLDPPPPLSSEEYPPLGKLKAKVSFQKPTKSWASSADTSSDSDNDEVESKIEKSQENRIETKVSEVKRK